MNGITLTLEGFPPSAFMNYSSWASCQRSKGRFEELNAGEGSFVSVTGSYCQGSSCLFLLSPSLQEEPPQSANEAFLGGFYLCIWKSQICKEFKVLGKRQIQSS
jgi:hypothetical protein